MQSEFMAQKCVNEIMTIHDCQIQLRRAHTHDRFTFDEFYIKIHRINTYGSAVARRKLCKFMIENVIASEICVRERYI